MKLIEGKRAIFLDVGHTLITPSPSLEEVVKEVLEESGFQVSMKVIRETMPLVDSYYNELYEKNGDVWASQEGAIWLWQELYGFWMKEIGIQANIAKDLGKKLYEVFGSGRKWEPFPDVPKALNAFFERGFVLGVVSNWDERLPRILAELGLAPYFKFIISSAEVGLAKPDERIFKRALDLAGVEPEEAVHIGDHLIADVEGPSRVGISPILIDRFNRLNGVKVSCPKIASLTELLVK